MFIVFLPKTGTNQNDSPPSVKTLAILWAFQGAVSIYFSVLRSYRQHECALASIINLDDTSSAAFRKLLGWNDFFSWTQDQINLHILGQLGLISSIWMLGKYGPRLFKKKIDETKYHISFSLNFFSAETRAPRLPMYNTDMCLLRRRKKNT